jgi:C-terminal processing protease CtpA/Prc
MANSLPIANMKIKVVVIVSLLVTSVALAASIVGIGVVLSRPNEKDPGIVKQKDPVVVKHVFPGSPAWKAGIKPEFCIISVDGADTADMSLSNCVGLIRGAPNTQVTLGVVDPILHQTNMVTLKRAAIQYGDSSTKQ